MMQTPVHLPHGLSSLHLDEHGERPSVPPIADEAPHGAGRRRSKRAGGPLLSLGAAATVVALLAPWLGADAEARRSSGPQHPGAYDPSPLRPLPAAVTPVSGGESEAPDDPAATDDIVPGALPFDPHAATKALGHRARSLSACRGRAPGVAARVDVTFTRPGVSTSARVVDAALLDTDTARCLEAGLVGVTVPAFQPERERTVRVTVTLP